jgi:hypothetical protein
VRAFASWSVYDHHVRCGSHSARSVAAILALGGGIATLGISAAGANANTCPRISNAKLAKAFGLQHATAYHVQGPEQLMFTTYEFSLCRAVAWSGSTPTNPQQVQEKINAGEGAGILIKTDREASGGTSEEIEKWHDEYEHQTQDFHHASMQLATKIFAPKIGGLAYETVSHGKLGIAAIWESDSAFAYVTISITERKGKPGRKSLEKIAATVVPGFF